MNPTHCPIERFSEREGREASKHRMLFAGSRKQRFNSAVAKAFAVVQ